MVKRVKNLKNGHGPFIKAAAIADTILETLLYCVLYIDDDRIIKKSNYI